jgi:hypothetical protein
MSKPKQLTELTDAEKVIYDRQQMAYATQGRLLAGVLYHISSGQFSFPEDLQTDDGYAELWLQWSEEHKDNPEIIDCVNLLSQEISESENNDK